MVLAPLATMLGISPPRRVGKVSLCGPLKLHWQIGSPSLVAGGLGVEPT